MMERDEDMFDRVMRDRSHPCENIQNESEVSEYQHRQRAGDYLELPQHQNGMEALKDVPRLMSYALRKTIFRPEVALAYAGWGITIHGFMNGETSEIIGGLLTSAVCGFYGAYRDGCFSDHRPQDELSPDITDKLH